MTLILQGAMMDNGCRFYFDVDTVRDNVMGIRLENDLDISVRVDVSRQGGNVIASQTFAPHTATDVPLPTNRRFKYEDALADWSYGMTPV